VRAILFVCTANICRSPMALAVMRNLAQAHGAGQFLELDSAGTHEYHVGKPPFPAAVELARRRGYDITRFVARRINGNDFDHFDHILAMDGANIAALKSIAPTRSKQKIELLLEYGDKYHGAEVPDPYGGKDEDFARALDMIEDGCRGLLEVLSRQHGTGN
jgi:protein-tyrosine phosphatase